jgi:HAMP domain-containing protein
MMRFVLVALLVASGLACFVGAWFSNARWTRQLDNLGIAYGCKRWPRETNNHYHRRLQTRIGWRDS